ncbi:MAG: GNAT family N-acetyltransferase [Cardiobacteriaceae bacterium]|nr:GNAT family N-acetyltransferase [Cardiobacteriaceae bacterium]
MKNIILTPPTLAHKAQLLALQQHFDARGIILAGAGINRFPDYESWLAFCHAPAGSVHPDGYAKVAASTFVAWDDVAQRIRGIIQIRHELNTRLREYGGHIGYSVHPDDWGKGYATHMLALALAHCDALGIRDVLITCHPDNTASARVIEKNGGVYDKTVVFNGRLVKHYWIARGC